ncbi:MAG: cellulase family glycosylhydrolase [Chitinophagaceae bacterium]
MKMKIIYVMAGVAITLLAISSCRKTKVSPQFSVSNITDTIPEGGGSKPLSFTCNDEWSIDTTGIGWLHLSQSSGNSGDASITLTAPANTTGISRTVLLKLNSANGQARRITVLQAPVIFPSYNTSPKAPDATGMGSTAMQINANIKLGMNIWNTMETPYGETGWGNPLITQSLIDTLKKAGFNAIRIPCQYWVSHANRATGEIDAAWLDRIKEVIQYCVNDGMYVLLNDHHDGFMDCRATGAKLDTIKAIQKAIWEQVATKLRDFDEHVMFASSNEPDANDLTSATNLHAFHQIFINAVRSTGGKNAYRTLVLQAPNTSLDLMNYFAPGAIPGLPKDPVPDKLMLEFHWYSPPNFCILGDDASWGKEWRYWGANLKSLTDPEHNSNPDYEEAYMERNMQWAKKSFVDKNIPVLIGEFGVQYHADDLAGHPADSILSLTSTAHFFGHLVRTARANGLSAFLWAGVINRQTETIEDYQQLDSLRKGAGY